MTTPPIASAAAIRNYRHNVYEFDVVLKYLEDAHEALRGYGPQHTKQLYCERILKKLILHCRAMRALAPNAADLYVDSDREWDPSTMAVIARCVIQSRDAFMYFAEPLRSREEDQFRIDLWVLHGRIKRQKLFALTRNGRATDAFESFKAETERLKSALLQNERFKDIDAAVRNKIKSAQTPYRYDELESCWRFSVHADIYAAAILSMSQSIHTLPEEVNGLLNFQAGSEDGVRSLSKSFMLVNPFISQVAAYCRTCFGGMIKIPMGDSRYIIRCQLAELLEGFS